MYFSIAQFYFAYLFSFNIYNCCMNIRRNLLLNEAIRKSLLKKPLLDMVILVNQCLAVNLWEGKWGGHRQRNPIQYQNPWISLTQVVFNSVTS